MKELFSLHLESVHRFLRRRTADPEVAQDLTQEVFLRAWKSRKQLKNVDHLRAWLIQIAYRQWCEYLRREKRVDTREDNHAFEWNHLEGREPDPKLPLEMQEFSELVISAVSDLPNRQREILWLRLVDRLSVNEIAMGLELEPANVRMQLSLSRKHLRSRLRDWEGSPTGSDSRDSTEQLVQLISQIPTR